MENEAVKQFLSSATFAVAGASTDRSKYGNRVFLALKNSGRLTYPLNPKADEIEGTKAFATLADLPSVPDSLSIVTPPTVTRQVVAQAIVAGVKNLWMQPGAEDAEASELARKAGLSVIDDGSCILVALALESHHRS